MKRLLLLITLMLFASTGRAQNNTDVSVKQINKDAGQATNVTRDDLFSSFSDLSQITDLQRLGADANNVANITVTGDRNEASIYQDGSGITGAINILGSDNTSSLTQKGSNLLSLINIDGSDNNLTVNQSGVSLGNLIQIEGAISNNLTVTQNNSGLSYQQGGSGSAMPIQIRTNATNVPLKITNY